MKVLRVVLTLAATGLVAWAFITGFAKEGWGMAFEGAFRALLVISLIATTVQSYRTYRNKGRQ